MTATSPRLRVAERRDGLAVEAGDGSPGPRDVPPWMPPWATPGTGRSGFHGITAASPTAKISGWPGHREVGLDQDPAGAIGGRAGGLRDRAARTRRRGCPAAQSTVRVGIASRRAAGELDA